jgi:hypothetical protein
LHYFFFRMEEDTMQQLKQACLAVGRAGWWALSICADARRQRNQIRRERRTRRQAGALLAATP